MHKQHSCKKVTEAAQQRKEKEGDSVARMRYPQNERKMPNEESKPIKMPKAIVMLL
jgi:hypothetical protein